MMKPSMETISYIVSMCKFFTLVGTGSHPQQVLPQLLNYSLRGPAPDYSALIINHNRYLCIIHGLLSE